MEGNTETLQAALYTVYFLYRRFFTVIVLVFATGWPYFQTTCLMVFSTINVVYMLSVKPLQTKFDNLLDLFNEICTLLVVHMMTICLNVAIPSELSDILGWLMIAVTSFNIFINLSLVGYCSIKDIVESRKRKAA